MVLSTLIVTTQMPSVPLLLSRCIEPLARCNIPFSFPALRYATTSRHVTPMQNTPEGWLYHLIAGCVQTHNAVHVLLQSISVAVITYSSRN